MEMETRPTKVGVLPCSGESEPEGTITRNAVRLVMEKYRPGLVVSLCLPLYLAGDGGERDFAKKVPVIAVDGCPKSCARLATEKYSGPVEASIDVRALLEQWGVTESLSRSHPGPIEDELAERVAREIVRLVDGLVEEGKVEVANV
ncbi:MAG: putative zinc-binding protein [Actinobacteria bacterium]|nr:putative zinc-binding protein [Actinomycetota bacterium]MBU1944895.1 putative zinc-binding protein [Actinomycetota bacterium]MBU2688099.1 putative zinc-binding protein [Actinomycetota bacterium]